MHSIYDNKNIFLALTYRCNAFCKKCMTRYHQNRSMEMSPDIFEHFICFLKADNYSGMVSMGTGEPLLFPYFDEAIQRILRVNDSICLRILTNGMALSNPLSPLLFGGRCKIGVTFDAFEQEQVNIVQRGVNIDAVKESVTKLSQTYGGDHFYLNYTLYQHNLDQLSEFCHFCVDNNIREIYVTELKVYQNYESELGQYRVVHDDKWRDALSTAKNYLKRQGISTRGIPIAASNERCQCFLCGGASPIIDVDGSVTFCSGREDIYIGNIVDADLTEKWSYFADRLNAAWCKGCHDHMLQDGTYSLPKTIQK